MKLRIPDLFKPKTAEDYIRAAVEAARWIQSLEVRETVGKTWKIFPDGQRGITESPFLGKRTFYAGSAGIGFFFLRLYQVTGDISWLNEAKAAADYLLSSPIGLENYRNIQKKIADNLPGVHGWAFSYKVGPISEGQFAHALFQVTGESRYEEFALKQAETFVEAALEKDGKIHWSDCLDIVGDAGGTVYLLQVYKATGNEKFLDAAKKFGAYIEQFGRAAKRGGTYFRLYDLERAGEGPAENVHVNFSHGSAGIAYLWAALFEATGERHYLDLANGIIEYLNGIAVGDDTAILFPYQDNPEGGIPQDRYYLGMCGGPIGSSLPFRKLYKATGDASYKRYVQRLVGGLVRAGVPERNSWGYWGSKCICCGGPGALEFFATLYRDSGESLYKDLADRTASVLLGDSFEENTGRTWYGAWDRISPDRVVSYTGFYIGAAGAAGALLKWAAVLQKKPIAEFFEYALG